jgi:DNA-binding transcriptional LysR family regulator
MYNRVMDLDGIAVFVTVVQAGSFSQAAKYLGMPNSTVSAKVSALEKRLGVTLLQRTTRKLHLTQAGEAYFRRCVQALNELQAAESEIASAQKEPQGLLRLTAPVEMGHSYLPILVHGFLKKYPLMGVDLVITNRVVDLVAEGVDLAIRAGKLRDSRLVARKFMLGHFSLWASPAYLKARGTPSHPKELTRHQSLRFSRFKAKAVELTNGEETATVALSGRVLADDFETLKTLAALGEGVTFLPSFLCAEAAAQKTLVRVLPQWRGNPVSFSIVYPAQPFVSPKIRGFIKVAEELLQDKNL